MSSHLNSHLYSDRPRERAFLMRCMAACVCRQQHKKLVCAHIDSIFASVRHAEPCERQVRETRHVQMRETDGRHWLPVMCTVKQVEHASATSDKFL